MTPRDDLFQLIKTMDRTEKGYLKKFASMHGKGNNNYLRLFDAIEAQEQYDEQAIKQYFKGEKFTRQLHVAKSYLYHLILKSLRNYHHESTEPIRLFNMLLDAELLFNRKLYADAQKMTKKTQSLIESGMRQRLVFLPLAHRTNNNILMQTFFGGLDEDDFAEWEQAYLGDMSLIYTQAQLDVQLVKIMRLIRKVPYANNPKQRAQFDAIISHPILQMSRASLPFNSQIAYLDIYQHYFVATRQHEAYAKGNHQLLQLIKSNPLYVSKKPAEYLTVLFNNIHVSTMLGDFDKAEALLSELYDMHVEVPNHKRMQEFYALSSELDLQLRKSSDTEIGKWLEKNVISIRKAIKSMIPVRQYEIMFMLSRLYHKAGNYNKAVDFVTPITQRNEVGNAVIYKYSWLILVIANHELKNNEVLPYLLKTMVKQFEKTEGYSKAEKIFIADFKKLIKLSEPDQKSFYSKMRSDILANVASPYEMQVYGNFDILAWLSKKL